jgi:peptidoglycan hydrolase FlgJ
MLGNDLQGAALYTDFAGLHDLRQQARKNEDAALVAVAQQFEALFMQMMVKSMRDAGGGGGLLDSEQSRMFVDMYDKQMATALSEQGRGIGLADMLVQQLRGKQAASSATAPIELAVPQRNERLSRTAPTSRVSPSEAATPQIAPSFGNLLPPHLAPLAATVATAEIATPPRPERLEDHPEQIEEITEIEAIAAPIESSSESETITFDSPEDFVRKLWPMAEAAAKRLGVAPQALIAQAALETGWGQAVIRHPDGSSSHNLFNIKADRRWEGDLVYKSTIEYRDGIAARERAPFRSYGDYRQSFDDYVNFIQTSPRYADALRQGSDPQAYIQGLQDAGYATDPAYARKIGNILARDLLASANEAATTRVALSTR